MSSQAIDLEALARAVRGRVIRPTDAAYDDTRRTSNAMLDRRPVVIAQPADLADVSAAISSRFIRVCNRWLQVAVPLQQVAW